MFIKCIFPLKAQTWKKKKSKKNGGNLQHKTWVDASSHSLQKVVKLLIAVRLSLQISFKTWRKLETFKKK